MVHHQSSLCPTNCCRRRRPLLNPACSSALNDAITGRKQLWLVLWEPYIADPTGLVTDALEQTYHRLGVGRTFHKMALMRFDVSPGPLLVESPSSILHAEFGEQIQLVGYDLPLAQSSPARRFMSISIGKPWSRWPMITKSLCKSWTRKMASFPNKIRSPEQPNIQPHTGSQKPRSETGFC